MTRQVAIAPDVLYQSLDDEAMLLHLPSERYFGLNSIGQRVWQLLEARQSLDVIHQQLLREYDVPADILRRDIDNLIIQLAKRDLIQVEG